MDKKKTITSLWTVLAVFFLVINVYVCVNIVRSGLTRIETLQMLRRAKEDWQHGKFSDSLKKYSRGTWMILEGGVRWQLAQIFLEQSKDLCRSGQFLEALDKCNTADRSLGGYDNEDSVGYECYLIDTRIKHPERFISSPSRPWLSLGLEDIEGE